MSVGLLVSMKFKQKQLIQMDIYETPNHTVMVLITGAGQIAILGIKLQTCKESSILGG